MSISAMKEALEALEYAAGLISPITKGCQCQICLAHTALRQAIAEAEKQPVHASDISQERVDETTKRKHEWVGLDDDIPGLGLVTEEFYNGMLCAEDILRKRNT